MSIAVVTAAGGAEWESRFIAQLAHTELAVARRCVDLLDLLAVAATGQATAVLLDPSLRGLDADAVERLDSSGVAVVAVTAVPDEPASDSAGGDDDSSAQRLTAIGVRHVIPPTATRELIESVLALALADRGAERLRQPSRGFADMGGYADVAGFADDPMSMLSVTVSSNEQDVDGVADLELPDAAALRGCVVAVWGPTGAPGRSTVAIGLADELSRLDRSTLLIDADVYGGVLAPALGLLDESPGLAAACRQAQTRRLDPTALAGLAWQLSPQLRLLSGLTRADRWPELRPAAVRTTLDTARRLSEFTVVDVGFSLETDEELSFDTMAPRRNGATLTVLDEADLVVVVAAADPLGVQRLVRALVELREAEIESPVWIVLNKVRKGPVPADPATELAATLRRFVGQEPAALLPYDRSGLDAALAAGKTLGELVPNSPLRRALVELAAGVSGTPTEGRSSGRRIRLPATRGRLAGRADRARTASTTGRRGRRGGVGRRRA